MATDQSQPTIPCVGQRVRIIQEPPPYHGVSLCAVGIEGEVTDRQAPGSTNLVAVRFQGGMEMWLAPETFEVISDATV